MKLEITNLHSDDNAAIRYHHSEIFSTPCSQLQRSSIIIISMLEEVAEDQHYDY